MPGAALPLDPHDLPDEAVGVPHARRARLAAVAEHVRPLALAREHTLPLAAPLAPLFPDGALRRGLTCTVDGPAAASFALALVTAPVQAGSWVAFVDLPALNLAAAAEVGVPLERVACVRAGASWAAAVAALVGAFDLVVVGRTGRARAGDVRRLVARARERGTVLVALGGACGAGAWPDAPDVAFVTTDVAWHGLGEGHGHLRACAVTVDATGRRAFARPRRVALGLPLAAPGAAGASGAREASPGSAGAWERAG